MAMVNPFAPFAELFTLTSLTASIESVIYQPRRLGQLGWWQEDGLTTLSAWVEYKDGALYVYDVKPRGAPGNRIEDGERNGEEFKIPHIPAEGAMLADEVQGIRAFGTENVLETVQGRIDAKMLSMRNSMEYTLEYHRMLNLAGNYMSADGTVKSLHTKLGTTLNASNFVLSASTDTDGQEQMFAIESTKLQPALGGLPYGGLHVLCSTGFWSYLLKDKGRKDSYKNQPEATQLRDRAAKTMDLWGATWEWYRGDSLIKIPDNKAYLVPTGVPDLFLRRNAPANYAETVNTVGRPLYVKSEPMKFNKGVEFEGQANPLHLITRPNAVVELTYAAS